MCKNAILGFENSHMAKIGKSRGCFPRKFLPVKWLYQGQKNVCVVESRGASRAVSDNKNGFWETRFEVGKLANFVLDSR